MCFGYKEAAFYITLSFYSFRHAYACHLPHKGGNSGSSYGGTVCVSRLREFYSFRQPILIGRLISSNLIYSLFMRRVRGGGERFADLFVHFGVFRVADLLYADFYRAGAAAAVTFYHRFARA